MSFNRKAWLSHLLLGRAYVEAGEPDRAVEAYTEAIKLDPLSASFYDHRAEAYESSRFIIEEIKKRLPVWKKELYSDGVEEWVAGTTPVARLRKADRP